MADPSSSVSLSYSKELSKNTIVMPIKDGVTLYPGALAAIDSANGRIDFADDLPGYIPCGVVVGAENGDNDSGLTGNSAGDYKVICKSGIVVEKTVAGVSAYTDIGDSVFATDGDTLTLTRPSTDAFPSGVIVDWDSSTTAWVYFYGLIEAVQAARGLEKMNVCLGTWHSNAFIGTSAAELLTDLALYGSGKIVDFFAVCTGYDDAIVAGDQDFTLDINSSAVTGASINLTYTECEAAADLGVQTSSTTITGANTYHDGDTLSLKMAGSGTGFTEDKGASFSFWIVVEKQVGA